MEPPTPFPELLARLRRGDITAIEEFVAHYEPFIRRTVRRRLKRSQLQAAADSVDVCQSVLGSFLIRIAAGEYDLNESTDLEKLLLAMARKKVAALARREYADRRDRGRSQSLETVSEVAGNPAEEPSFQAASRDLMEEIRRRLPEEERHLFQQRQEGKSWDTIAAGSNATAVLLRKRLSRALQKVAVELGLEEPDE